MTYTQSALDHITIDGQSEIELDTGLLDEASPPYHTVDNDPNYNILDSTNGSMALGGNGTTNGTEDIYHFYQTEQLTFLCILFAFIVIGNASVMVAIILSKNRKSRMNFFILQLAIADMATGLITVLTDILWKSTIEWHAGNVGCKIVRYMQAIDLLITWMYIIILDLTPGGISLDSVSYKTRRVPFICFGFDASNIGGLACVTMMSSTYMLVAMSIDRLDAIARPMNFAGSGKRARILVCLAWGIAGTLSIPILVINKEMVIRNDNQCWIDLEPWQWKVYVTILALLLFIIPAIIIAICYTVIVIIIWSKSSVDSSSRPIARRFISKAVLERRANGHVALHTSTPASSASSSRGVIPKARIKTIKMTLVIVLVFIICWSPFFVFDLLDVYGHIAMSQRKVAVAVFIQSLAPLNSAANPVIYCLFSTRTRLCSSLRRFRLCEWFATRCCCQRPRQVNRKHSATNVTDFSSGAEDPQLRRSNNRRHSATPFVKVKLNEKENEILLKHVSRNGRHYMDTEDEGDSIVSSV